MTIFSSINKTKEVVANEVAVVEVVSFEEKRPERPQMTRRDHKAFMSSSIAKVTGKALELQNSKLTTEELEQDKEDDDNDRELMDLIKTTQLVKQYTSAELTGKDRMNHMKRRIVELGGRVSTKLIKAAKEPKVSLPMHLGMMKAANKRVSNQVKSAKDLGIYTQNLKDGFVGKEKALRFPAAVEKKERAAPNGDVSRMRNGVMTISKSLIDSIENKGNRKSSRGGRGGRGGSGRGGGSSRGRGGGKGRGSNRGFH